MAKDKQKTIEEKWALDSKEKDGGLAFHEKPAGAPEFVEIEGFSDEELKRIMGDEQFTKYQEWRKKKSVDKGLDEIEEI